MTTVEWSGRGLCRDDPEAWMTGKCAGRPQNAERAARSRAVVLCQRCPVLADCVRFTLSQPDLPSECVQAGKTWPVLLRDRETIAADLKAEHDITTHREYRKRQAKPAKTIGVKARRCLHCGDWCYPRRDASRPGMAIPAGAKQFEAKGLCRDCYRDGRMPRFYGRGKRPGPCKRTRERLVLVAKVLEEDLTPAERNAKLCGMFGVSESTAKRYVQAVAQGALRRVS